MHQKHVIVRSGMAVRVYINSWRHFALIIRPEKGGAMAFHGTPMKVFAAHLLLTNSKVKGWEWGKGVEVETSEEVIEAIRLLKEYRGRIIWRKLVDWHLLPNPTPERVIQALSIDAVLTTR